MYIIPNYIECWYEGSALFITSQFRKNTVKLTTSPIIQEFESIRRCGGCANIVTPLQRFLHEQEMLLNEVEIRCVVDELHKIMDDTLLLTIMPTEGCNFRCSYCYETHKAICMSRGLIDQVQHYIVENAPRFPYVKIAWFGGEPTLCKDTILETNEIVQRLQREHSFAFLSSMTTNGYLLGIEDFKMYYDAGITDYQITLDGWNHDETRPHVTGRGTLTKILENLTEISSLPQEKYTFRIVLRHNILLGDEDYTWYDHLYELFGKDSRFFVLVRPVCNWGGETVERLSLLKEKAADELVKKHSIYVEQIGLRCDNLQGGLLSQVCYASYPNSMIFRTDGRIEKCTVCLDHPQNLIGHVDENGHVNIIEEKNNLWCNAVLKSECYQCKDVLACLNHRCPKKTIVDASTNNCCTPMR